MSCLLAVHYDVKDTINLVVTATVGVDYIYFVRTVYFEGFVHRSAYGLGWEN